MLRAERGASGALAPAFSGAVDAAGSSPATPDSGAGGASARRRAGTLGRPQGTVSALRPSAAITVEETSSVVDAAQLMAAKRCARAGTRGTGGVSVSASHLVVSLLPSSDCVLVTNFEGALSGIFTDKDLAYRVVAEGLDPRGTSIAQGMTPNPDCCTDTAMATDALAQMASGNYRHLPVQDEGGDVVGVLDITRCLYEALEKLERAHGDSQRLVDAVAIMDSFAGTAPQAVTEFVNHMREKMACPTLASVVRPETRPNDLNVRESVREAVRIMKAFHQTAVLATENGRLAGIFTTKDCVVRGVAAGLDPSNTSLVRVMTPHPDTASTEMTILQALHRMHGTSISFLVPSERLRERRFHCSAVLHFATASRYLHLPVVNEANGLIGMTDVLQLTYAMLEQVKPSDGPMWNKFWQSTFMAEEVASVHSASVSEFAARDFLAEAGGEVTESVLSDTAQGAYQGLPGHLPQRDEASAIGLEPMAKSRSVSSLSLPLQAGAGARPAASSAAADDGAAAEARDGFVFKFRERSGAVHRFTVTSRTTLAELLCSIRERVHLHGPDVGDDFSGPEVLSARPATEGGVVPSPAGRARHAIKISYLDDENDQVVVAKDEDLQDAVQVARMCGWPVLPLFVSARTAAGEWESLGQNDEKTVESEVRRRRGSEARRGDGKPVGSLAAGLEGLLLPCAVGIGVAVVAFLFSKQMSK
ncbi:MAG: hypothetical protein BJ554DRAFT_5952 [Olpidium bornovanus]|uniref:CBS domain-containing protein n=1 Tax=Olpidium bornovanus TaxID=278681 RepID=A0A8H7ZYQ9_9FUNG|nr:MAG: hypothetical protein BJ554DRAFT_5952 [Olpidium bornovanus]